jgi:hypothetical protein
VTATMARRPCPICGQLIPLNADWQFFTHYADREQCAGSRTDAPRPEARRNRHGSRWR